MGQPLELNFPMKAQRLTLKVNLMDFRLFKGHLHNHDITINVVVNESISLKRNLNDQDRYNRLHEINPNIELLRTTFGLDLNI